MMKKCERQLLEGCSRLDSVGYALKGIMKTFTMEKNFRIESIIMCLVVIAGFLLKISRGDWMIAIFCFSSVMCLEIVNTALERLCDKVTMEKDAAIGSIKDIAAGAVLISSIASAIIGGIIFIPYILKLL